MTILPAIDIRGGKCVRLRQGDFQHETVYGDDPVAIALQWEKEGAQALHLVDLDGARVGRPVNIAALRSIAQTVKIPCQAGGGLRSETDLQGLFDFGIKQAVIGTQGCHDQDWLSKMAQRFPHQLLLGLDAKEGQIATDGWLEVSGLSAFGFAVEVSHLPLAGIVYTDIARDGMLSGPNWEGLAEMKKSTRLPVIASGGVSSLEDVRRLRKMELAGCIIGKALYEQTITLREALIPN